MKTTVLYHNDADGFGAAYAVWVKYREEATYIPVQYGQSVPEIPEGTIKLIIVDFSYTREICEELNSKYDLLILDHHKSAQADLEGLDYAIFDQNKSGCALAWEFFHPGEPMPELLAYIQDRDLWRFALNYSEEINLYIATLEHDFSEWHAVACKWPLYDILQAGRAIMSFRANQIKGTLRDVRMMRLTVGGDTYEVPVANCSANVSEVGNDLCEEYPDAPFSVTYCDRKDVRSWSLRSKGFDVSEVARQLGGGGHAKAAGFTTEIGWPEHTGHEFIEAFEEAADGK